MSTDTRVGLTSGVHGDPANLILPVMKRHVYDGRFPTFKQPIEIGHFSINGERHFCPDGRNLKYLCRSKLRQGPVIDLNKGFDTAILKRPVKEEKLDMLLHYIKDNLDAVRTAIPPRAPSEIFGADFVCFRGLLTMISCTPSETKEDWVIYATKFKGTIYLCSFPTEMQKRKEDNATPREKRMCYWGRKFEQYMLSDSPEKRPDETAILNENEEYCVVVKGKLNEKKVLFGAEIDGIDPNYPRNGPLTDCYVELKTSRVIQTEHQNNIFLRHKAQKFWVQSFLIGIPRVMVGFRNDGGIVQDLQTYSTKDLSNMRGNFWSPSAMMNFVDIFLTFIKSCVTKDHPRYVYKFTWSPGQNVKGVWPLSPSEDPILSEWYINHFT